MSLGALSPEAHETLIAMNRIGAKSDTGEGGEDPAHFTPEPNGDNAVGQDQAGRPGRRRDGGISERLRESWRSRSPGRQARRGPAARHEGHGADRAAAPFDAGRDADQPPPHHDIYSIEDLAQLIYDLKQINPRAKVTVKLCRQRRRHHRGGRGRPRPT
jgi:glutamate synthase (NADPH/NADH) large chain